MDNLEVNLAEARTAFSEGNVLRAIDALQQVPEGQRRVTHRQMLALALLRAGASVSAREIIRDLVAEGHDDEETLGLVAREAKARWLEGEASALVEAQAAYQSAFERTGGAWTGVNAATLALLMGDVHRCRKLAQAVRDELMVDPSRSQSAFWTQATLGETSLLLGHMEQARACYRTARALAPAAWGDLGSVRRQAREILRAHGADITTMDDLFPAMRVAVFSGHMMDAVGRPSPRFPADDEPVVRAAIEAMLAEGGFVAGISAAACGADILFLEALQARGVDTHIVLPHDVATFRQESVTAIAGEQWGARFDSVVSQAREVTLVSEHRGEDLSYQFHGEVMAGLARLKGRTFGSLPTGIAYWDGQPGGVGGTASVVQEWACKGMRVDVLGYRDLPARVIGRDELPAAMASLQSVRASSGQRIVALLFADVVGFSKLGEFQIKSFFQEFWGRTAALLEARMDLHPLEANTWGDGLFLVFPDPVQAARAAIGLTRMVAETPWMKAGVAAHIGIRVALHAGPVYEVFDPITKRPGHAGMHISRAARIEPVTPPGQVYVSEPYAALLSLDDTEGEFSCEYMGIVPLAKDYGQFRTYRLVARPT